MHWVIGVVLIRLLTYLIGVLRAAREMCFPIAICVGVRHRKMLLELLGFIGILKTEIAVQLIIRHLWVHYNPHILPVKIHLCYVSGKEVFKVLIFLAGLAHI